MPKKMRRAALRCVLSGKATDGELVVVDAITLAQPGTKQMVGILNALGIESSVLVVTSSPDANVVKSARNLEKVSVLPAAMLNVGDLLSHKVLLMTVDAARRAEEVWGRKESVAEAQPSQ
jgi:large subunit ribosomal protein L4